MKIQRNFKHTALRLGETLGLSSTLIGDVTGNGLVTGISAKSYDSTSK